MVKIGDIEIAEFPLILAPMEDVSDPPFRYVCKKQGVDLMFTEFISSEGLIRDAVKSKQKLDIFEYERPVGIQIFGNNIESMEKATELASAVNPDIIDINYGCPVKKVACKGAGAGILQDIDKMVRMTKAIVDSTDLPVTVKTRLGWDEDTKYVVEVAERLQDVGIKAISVHGRTRKQMYKGEADWSLIGDIKNNQRMHIPVFGNGDVNTPEIAKEKKDRYGVDGIMIGRASIGYPWIFREIKHYLETGEHLAPPTFAERKEACISHFEKSMHWKGDWKGVVEMRRHYANYFKGIRNFKPTRMELVTEADPDKIRAILNNLKEEHFLEPAAQ